MQAIPWATNEIENLTVTEQDALNQIKALLNHPSFKLIESKTGDWMRVVSSKQGRTFKVWECSILTGVAAVSRCKGLLDKK